MRRLVLVLVSTLALLVPTGSAVAQSPDKSVSRDAAARVQWHQVKKPYVHNWVFRSKKLKRCVFFEVKGSIAGKWRYAYGPDTPDHDTLEWADIGCSTPPCTPPAGRSAAVAATAPSAGR